MSPSEDRAPAKASNLALRGADLLDRAADKLVSGGWIETGLLVLLLGRALIVGHRISRDSRKLGRPPRVIERVRPPEKREPESPKNE